MFRRRVTILLVSILLLIWVVYVYMQTPVWPGEAMLPWAANIIRYQIYWVLRGFLTVALTLLERWIQIESPVIGLGGFMFLLLLALNLRSFLKDRRHQVLHTVYCPLDELPARPIRGTINRYRCRRGHQFSGEPHSHH